MGIEPLRLLHTGSHKDTANHMTIFSTSKDKNLEPKIVYSAPLLSRCEGTTTFQQGGGQGEGRKVVAKEDSTPRPTKKTLRGDPSKRNTSGLQGMTRMVSISQ